MNEHEPLSDSKEIPAISVIITAQGRKQYLLEAVNSVLSQKKAKGAIEVVVVKDFSDENIDRKLMEYNVRSILRDCSLGEMLDLGITASLGDIICFLDDDDAFERDKIDIVSRVFRENPQVEFLSHSQYLLKDSNPYENLERNEVSIRKIDLRAVGSRNLTKLTNEGVDFNLSSICIKRALISENLDQLRGLKGGPDTFFFLLAVRSGTTIARIDNKLTRYRVRTTEKGKVVYGERDMAVWARRSEFMLEMTDKFAHTSNLKCDILASYLHNDWKITRSIITLEKSKRTNLWNFKNHLAFMNTAISVYYFVKLFLALAMVFSPKKVRKLYLNLKNNKTMAWSA